VAEKVIKRIKGGRVIEPGVNLDAFLDVIIEGDRIKSLVAPGDDFPDVAEVIDATGKLVTPGLIDIHTHLRDPGQEYKESIETGTRAAASGGITTVACMANTDPVNDNAGITRYMIKKACRFGYARVVPIGAVTKGLAGEELSEMAELAEAGCGGFSDDGKPVMNAELMRRAMEYAGGLDKVIIVHAEDSNLSGGGVMNEGKVSTRLGLEGIPAAAEEAMIARDIILSKLTGAPVHFAHVSTAGSVELIRWAKERLLPVTAETCPHYFTLTQQAVRGYDTSAKVNPPLRTEADVEAVREGLADGTIDCIVSDHAPHARHEKEVEFDLALPGISGIETLLGLTMRLVEDGTLSLIEAIRKLTFAPARVLGLDAGTLGRGSPADITLIDPDVTWRVDPAKFESKGKYTPFEGMELKGKACLTIVGGQKIQLEES